MNHKAMLELADHMDKMPPEQFDMSDFGAFTNTRKRSASVKNHCGAVCCIAGEKVLLDGGKYRPSGPSLHAFVNKNGKRIEPWRYSKRALRLEEYEAYLLFTDYSLKTPQQAASKIRRMVAADQKASA